MAQKNTSKNTSINSTKLPAVYGRINWEVLKLSINKDNPVLLDYGAGKYTDHIREFCSSNGFKYETYDPYNGGTVTTEQISTDYISSHFDAIVCSNVLNVIDDDDTVFIIPHLFDQCKVPYFITVYEGDGSGIGKISKNDCYQRNQKLKDYMTSYDQITKNNVLTNKAYKYLIKY